MAQGERFTAQIQKSEISEKKSNQICEAFHFSRSLFPAFFASTLNVTMVSSRDTPWLLVQSRFPFSTLETPTNEAD